MIDDLVVIGVELGRSELGCCSHTNHVANTLAQWAGGALDARGPAELRVTWGLAVQLTEVGHLFLREIVTSHVEPSIQEHGAVSTGQNEAITVDPLWVVRVVGQLLAKQDSSDVSASQRKTKMS